MTERICHLYSIDRSTLELLFSVGKVLNRFVSSLHGAASLAQNPLPWGLWAARIQQVGAGMGARHADEGVSGALDVFERPGLQLALGQLRRGWTLLVARMDRRTRDVDVAGEIRMVVRLTP